jgi:cbb3-type cytochrome oxidase maturation protein
MKIIFLLIAASLLLAGGFLAAFFWAVRTGQYEDEYTPSMRILFDDAPPAADNQPAPSESQITNNPARPSDGESRTDKS